jgi:predicted metal-binding membrane protein
MWAVMMLAMMLPLLVPVLRDYRIGVHKTAVGSIVGQTDATSNGRLMMIAVGYFFVWTAVGMVVFPVGIALASIAMHEPTLARAVPVAAGTIVLLAGLFQLTAAKARYLACCRHPVRCEPPPANAAAAWRDGVRLALRCARCCANLMAILLVIGVMDLRAMAVVTAVIAAERLASPTERIARAIGVGAVAAGLLMLTQAANLP